jgi:hypothetical protein
MNNSCFEGILDLAFLLAMRYIIETFGKSFEKREI